MTNTSEQDGPDVEYLDDADWDEWTECWQCHGEGRLSGCFEDTCCCLGDPEDPDTCCAPERCDVCEGAGGWSADELEEAGRAAQTDKEGEVIDPQPGDEGRAVVYARHDPHRKTEYGVVSSWNEHCVFVRYGAIGTTAQATNRGDLEWALKIDARGAK